MPIDKKYKVYYQELIPFNKRGMKRKFEIEITAESEADARIKFCTEHKVWFHTETTKIELVK